MNTIGSLYWAPYFNDDDLSSPLSRRRVQPQKPPPHPARPQNKPRSRSIATHRTQLLEALRLQRDPFNQCVTERETHFQFNEIYVELEESILDTLSDEAQSAFCFADYGMGKSATRLALEYKLRLDPQYEDILCVRYTPNYQEIDDKLLTTITDDICDAMALDSLTQVVERSQRIVPDLANGAFRRALYQQASMLPNRFRRALQTKLKCPNDRDHESFGEADVNGVPDGIFWPTTIRPAVEMISQSAIWRSLTSEILAGVQNPAPEHLDWQHCIAAVQTLGFKRIFILIDVVDETTDDPERWLPFLANLFEYPPEWQAHNIY